MHRVRQTSFEALSATAQHPLVVITLFLALLDAVRAQQLRIEQAKPFGPIFVSLASASCIHA
jgi:chromatin segregation and condensation protein Rec8/ScpA/Scc1 (kleisin family)